MWVGALAIYGPLALFWPFTYFKNGAMARVYLMLWKYGHFWVGSAYHITVLIMFWWARRKYLFETTLAYDTLSNELDIYAIIILGLFRMSTVELRLPFT